MPRDLSTPIAAALHLVSQDQAFLLFAEISRPSGEPYRLVRASRHVVAGGETWQACRFEFEPAEETADGDLSAFKIGVPNISRILFDAVESGNVLGQSVTIFLGHESDLADLTTLVSGEIELATVREKAGVLTCGEVGKSMRVPARIIDRATFPQVVSGRGGQI